MNPVSTTQKVRSHRGPTQISKSPIGCGGAGRIGFGIQEEEVDERSQKSWLTELLQLLNDSTLVRIAEELASGFAMETVRRHCKLKVAEWRAQLARLQKAITALFDGNTDAVASI